LQRHPVESKYDTLKKRSILVCLWAFFGDFQRSSWRIRRCYHRVLRSSWGYI